ncbi:MAG: hypothetical protein HY796_05485 [Elusimicrobia bacterium]|nr:hypothetical protein [Elusimicrobiota bacterium]
MNEIVTMPQVHHIIGIPCNNKAYPKKESKDRHVTGNNNDQKLTPNQNPVFGETIE